MIVPLIVYILGLVTMGFIKLLMNPAVNAFFNVSMTTGPEMTLLSTMWDYFLLAYFIVGVILLFILAQKRGGGPFG